MDGKIEISLDSYTSLVRENERLKANLTRCYKQMRASIDDNINTYRIDKMTKEECQQALSEDDRELVSEFAFSDGVRNVIDEWPCFTKAEVDYEFSRYIYDKIRDRMSELPGDEK